MQHSEQLPQLSPSQSSRLLKRALRLRFKGVKFSVKLSTGTAYGNVHVSWSDGPTGNQVREVSESFRGMCFDGMSESVTHLRTSVDVNGVKHRSGLGLILLHRDGYVD